MKLHTGSTTSWSRPNITQEPQRCNSHDDRSHDLVIDHRTAAKGLSWRSESYLNLLVYRWSRWYRREGVSVLAMSRAKYNRGRPRSVVPHVNLAPINVLFYITAYLIQLGQSGLLHCLTDGGRNYYPLRVLAIATYRRST